MQGDTKQKTSVLFVCLGNICRSPMAQGALETAARKAGLNIRVDSVGTASYHVGESPDPRAIATAARHGVDISGYQGRQLCDRDFETFTHIFALDTANLAGIRGRAPRHSKAEIGLLLDVLADCQGESVPDPYYGDDDGFETCWATIMEAVDTLVTRLESEQTNA